MNYTLEIIKVLFALLGVLVLFYLVVKFLRERKSYFNGGGQIKVVDRCYLGSDKIIYLVKVIDKGWLVASTKDKLDFIEEVDLSEVEIKDKAELLTFFRRDKDEFNED